MFSLLLISSVWASSGLQYTLCHKESLKCLTHDWDLGECTDLFRIEYSFEKKAFMIYSCDEDKYIDFNYQDPDHGLRGTSSTRKAKMYMKPRNRSRTEFIFADSKDKKNARYMAAVDDGGEPAVWIGNDSPYDDSSNIDNFTWIL